jgi:hypothetical protein
VALAAAGIALAAWRFGRHQGDFVSQLLLAGIVVIFGVFVVTTYVRDLAAAREIAPLLAFAAALAGRQLGPWLAGAGLAGSGRWARLVAGPALGLVLAGYLAGLGLELTTPSAPPQGAQLTAWLSSHPLGSGLSGYWTASVVTLTSGGRVAVRPLIIGRGDRLLADNAEVKDVWFDPAQSSADFVVLSPGFPGYPGFTDRRAVLAAFGPPARTYHVGQDTILWWRKNLLKELG